MSHRILRHALLLGLGLTFAPTAWGYCPFSSPIAHGMGTEASPGRLVPADAAAPLGGFFWELGRGDPADGSGNDSGAALTAYPPGPGDAAWIVRDAGGARIDWDWFHFGSDGCLSGGAGAGVVVAFILDGAPSGTHYALLAVSGTASPVPAHDFDAVNTASGAAGNEVPLAPLALVPSVHVTPVDESTVSVDVAPALASVNVHDDLGGAGPYAGLLNLSGVTDLHHRLPGGGDETLLPGCIAGGCTGLLVPADRELCWGGSAVAMAYTVPGEATCEGGVMHGFACIPDWPEDACIVLGGTCDAPPPTVIAMGPAIPGGCTALDAQPPQDLDDDGFFSGADCDDGDPSVHPGGFQLCDGRNNDCDHPDWPDLPAAECFPVDGLTVALDGAAVRLDWNVPEGGAEEFRVFQGTDADLVAGFNGGSLVASPGVNTVELPAAPGFSFYVVAGVRDGIRGSLGQDSQGGERRALENQ